MLRPLWIVAIGISVSASALAADPAFPELTGRVVDEAGFLDTALESELSQLLARHESETTNQVVVVTLSSLQGYAIEEFGYRLGRHWGIGQKDKDNGVLLIVAPNERRVRIEVGYGLEGDLTDAISKSIIELAMIPSFLDGDYPAGTKAGVLGILAALEGSSAPLNRHAAPPNETNWMSSLLFVIYVAALGLGMIMMYRNAPKEDPPGTTPIPVRLHQPLRLYSFGRFGGGGSRRSGFRGGGGSFGGGGASGRW